MCSQCPGDGGYTLCVVSVLEMVGIIISLELGDGEWL